MKKRVTREQRLARAQAKASAALSIFEGVALDLDEAATALADVAGEAEVEAERLLSVRNVAAEDSIRAFEQAAKVREFVGR